MKKLVQVLMILALALSFSGCGKEENSSGGSSSSKCKDSNRDGICDSDWYNGGNGNNGTGFGNFDDLKTYYQSKSMANGLSAGDVVYHIGPDYGMQINNFELDFGFYTCINWFGELKGDCADFNNNTSVLENIVESGEYKIVQSVSTNSVSYDEATDIVGGQFLFTPRMYNSSDSLFREMLNMDNSPVIRVVVSQAQIRLTNNQVISGDLVEYFFGYAGSITDIKRFVLSRDLPVMANPIANINEYGQFTGVLNNVGDKLIRSIQATAHTLQYNPYTNQSNVVNAGVIGITIN